MTTWDDRLNAHMRELEWPVTMCDAGRWAAEWQRNQLLTDEAIDRATDEMWRSEFPRVARRGNTWRDFGETAGEMYRLSARRMIEAAMEVE